MGNVTMYVVDRKSKQVRVEFKDTAGQSVGTSIDTYGNGIGQVYFS